MKEQGDVKTSKCCAQRAVSISVWRRIVRGGPGSTARSKGIDLSAETVAEIREQFQLVR